MTYLTYGHEFVTSQNLSEPEQNVLFAFLETLEQSAELQVKSRQGIY